MVAGHRFRTTLHSFNYSCSISGMVDLEEIVVAFKELGIDIDRKEAVKLLERYALLKNSISGFHWFIIT